MSVDYCEFYTETNGKSVKYCTLLSIHFGRLNIYQDDWSIVDKIYFEAMLVLYRKYGNDEFYYQEHRWEALTGISAHLLRKSRYKLEKIGLITVTEKWTDDGKKKMNFFDVHYNVIKEKLDKIYDFSDMNPEEIAGIKGMMESFFDYWSVNNYYIPEQHEVEEDEVVADSRDQFTLTAIDEQRYEQQKEGG